MANMIKVRKIERLKKVLSQQYVYAFFRPLHFVVECEGKRIGGKYPVQNNIFGRKNQCIHLHNQFLEP